MELRESKNTEPMLPCLSYEHPDSNSCIEKPASLRDTAKTRESVAKSLQAVNGKSSRLAWETAYRALLQFQDTQG